MRRRGRQGRGRSSNLIGCDNPLRDAAKPATFFDGIGFRVEVADEGLVGPSHPYTPPRAGQAELVVHNKVGSGIVEDDGPIAFRVEHAIAVQA